MRKEWYLLNDDEENENDKDKEEVPPPGTIDPPRP